MINVYSITKGSIMVTLVKSGISAARHRSFRQWLRKSVALSRQRQNLLELDAHLLQDIGITRKQAISEAQRPVWDVPANWRQ
jgi:uncharacterized protein YjiS (DUF1127 family)